LLYTAQIFATLQCPFSPDILLTECRVLADLGSTRTTSQRRFLLLANGNCLANLGHPCGSIVLHHYRGWGSRYNGKSEPALLIEFMARYPVCL
jgi:hypothetical protein